MELKGKMCVVTGASDGLGKAITQALVTRGCKVYDLSRSGKSAEPDLVHIDCDISDNTQVEKAIGQIPHFDVLINNAGIYLWGEIQDNTPEDIKRVVDVNLTGMMLVTRAVLPKLIAQNDGFILNVCSTSGLVPKATHPVYIASKFGTHGFTEALKIDLEKTNIKVAGLYPGGMSTKFFEKSGINKDNASWMDVNKVAKIAICMLEQDDTMVMDQVVVNRRKNR